MVNFRYHVVSLVAVFLALGLGILMGSTVIDQGLVERLESQTRSLGNNLDSVRNENGELRSDIALWDSFGESTLVPLTKNRLAGRNVLVVLQDGTDPHLFDAVSQSLRDAGASTAGRLAFSPKWSLKEEIAREQLAVALGVQAGPPGDLWPEAAGRLAGRLGQSKDPTEQGDLLTALRDAGFLSVDASSTGVFPPAGTLVVVVASGVRDASPPHADFFIPFLKSLALARKTLAAEPANAADSLAERVRGDADLRARISTIDDVDAMIGRVAMVFTLRTAAAGGKPAHYGSRRSAGGLVPPGLLTAR